MPVVSLMPRSVRACDNGTRSRDTAHSWSKLAFARLRRRLLGVAGKRGGREGAGGGRSWRQERQTVQPAAVLEVTSGRAANQACQLREQGSERWNYAG
jgi:hypothetical protein